jgi:hypothetical protein
VNEIALWTCPKLELHIKDAGSSYFARTVLVSSLNTNSVHEAYTMQLHVYCKGGVSELCTHM